MARNNNRDRVRAIGEADGARGVGVADAAGEFAVRNSFAVRDFAKAVPNFLLKFCACGREGQVEVFQLAGEISAKLADGLPQPSRIFLP